MRMRISTALIYERGVAGIQARQSDLLKTQQQLSTGRRVLTPADDPVASAQALQLTQAVEINARQRVNRDFALGPLQNTESAVAQVGDLLQRVREIAVAGGDASYSDAERRSLVDELRGIREELLGLANSSDAEGHYMFAGYQGSTRPFVQNAGTVQYLGDDGERLVQAGPSRQIALNLSGAEVFERIRNGNGHFVWGADPANTGTGILGPGIVADPTLLTGDSYQITFSVIAGVSTYDVVDTTTATTILAAQPYDGVAASIVFDGARVDLQGAPADGDVFTVDPSTDQSLFVTVDNLIAALSGPGGVPLANKLGLALSDIDQAIDKVVSQRVSLGNRLREIESLNGIGEDLSAQYQDAHSKLVDVDYAQAASDLAREQVSLEAAQQSFVRITGLSLFNYL
jgi:flagellar hook-associated protein 3 FlgL